jgi:hypothetical protein
MHRMSIRAASCLRSSRQVARASFSTAIPTHEQDRRILGIRQRPTKDMADIVVTSNLAYDRFALDAAPSGMAAYYRRLSAKPHLDVSNGRPTVGYFNPALRIVAMDGSVDRLRRIAAEIKAAAPSLKVELIEPPNSGE